MEKEYANLISDIEEIIGNNTYNPNSYDGYTGEMGRSFRYPVWQYDRENDQVYKSYSKIASKDIEKGDILIYKFGSNHLYISDAIIEVLEYLENRYDIDFSTLEVKYTTRT